MKRILSWIGFAISLSCMAFFIISIAPRWRAISTADWGMGTWSVLLVALCFYMATYASATLAWQVSLRILDKQVAYAKLARILLLSQFAKYLPGNVGHHVGRVMLARRIGLPIDSIVVSMAIDTMILLVAALTCSVPAFALMWSLLQEHGADHGRIALGVLSMAAVALAVLFLVPATRREIVRHGRLVAQLCHRHKAPLFARGWFVHCFAFLLGATTLYLVCSALSGDFGWTWPSILGVYTVAWLLGFVMPGAPAGIGIREVALLVGLAPIYGEQQAIAAAATLRLVTTSGDGIVFLFALGRWGRNTNAVTA